MASDGVIKIVCLLKSKTEKKMDDCCALNTSLNLGMASGAQGPFIFLTMGKTINCMPMKDLKKNFECPPGLLVVPLPSAFMTDEVWLKVVLSFVKGIRTMPVIKDHPN